MQLRLVGSALLCALTAAAHAAPVPIDLRTWSQRGPAANGNWNVAADGSSVLQTVNGNPTFFVSPDSHINTTLRGQMRVETTSDDDFIGFVLGFKSPVANGNDMDFLLFDWKRAAQSSGGLMAQQGFALSQVKGTITNYVPGFWGHSDSPEFDVLATNYGAGKGWAANITYDFTILYQDNRVRIDLAGGAFGAGQTIFDIAGNFQDGSFGFYNYSQAQVRYSGLTEEDSPLAVSAPGSLALALLGLAAAASVHRRVPRRGGATRAASIGLHVTD
jgi:hypothetical protein